MKMRIFALLLSSMLATSAFGAVAYEGVTECDGMKVTITFVWDQEASVIRDFTANHGCIDGTGGMVWSVGVAIDVAEDGSFSHTDSYGNGVSGKLNEDGTAAGSILGGGISMKCADEEFHKMCLEWTAKEK